MMFDFSFYDKLITKLGDRPMQVVQLVGVGASFVASIVHVSLV